MLHSVSFAALGTECQLHLYVSNPFEAEIVAEAIMQEVFRLHAKYSRYSESSFLSEINAAGKSGSFIDVDEETAGLLDYAFACYEKSDGLFDITSGVLRKVWDFSQATLPEQQKIDDVLPLIGLDKVIWKSARLRFSVPNMELDFGGIAKEYAADRAVSICKSLGIKHGLIDFGGDIAVVGSHPDKTPWQIGISHPRNPDIPMASVEIDHGALATSGDYERYIEISGQRYCHLLNPKTGWSVNGLSSVSVISEQCLVAGSITTIALLKGLSGIQWLNQLNVQHVWMDNEGRQGGNAAVFPPNRN
ncbi:MAG: FAD:protein FMN transferase [Methylococcales bacterium]|nr:FAD:protein FMN transferase [Methylococcales bacterium]